MNNRTSILKIRKGKKRLCIGAANHAVHGRLSSPSLKGGGRHPQAWAPAGNRACTLGLLLFKPRYRVDKFEQDSKNDMNPGGRD